MQRLAVLAMIGSAAAWGGGTVMSKALLDEGLPPVTLLVVQLLASCTVLWLIAFGGVVYRCVGEMYERAGQGSWSPGWPI
jgi:drug/metabolite transporter (DMT)-like permease